MSGRKRILFVDGTSGASGDMILGALIDVGVPFAPLRRTLEQLPLEGWSIRSRRLTRCALVARKIDVRLHRPEAGRGWKDIRRIVTRADLDPGVRDRALAIFRRLLEAEGNVHGKSPDEVHLHEAGGTDAIIDIVGTCIALAYLRLDEIVVSPLTTGWGTIDCAHGRYPVPGPATLELVRGIPIQAGDLEIERLTPTGAAILTTVADRWSSMPALRPLASGYGAGSHAMGSHPNMLRVVLGEHEDTSAPGSGDDPGHTNSTEVVVIECSVDDCTPQVIAWTIERLLGAGALDAYVTPVTMKKGRPGHLMTVLARPDRLQALSGLMLRETTSFGLRARVEHRIELERRSDRVRTPFGAIRVKVGMLDGIIVQTWPEFEDCVKAAAKYDVPLKRVQHSALECWAPIKRQKK